jgi:hypothetical protein
VSSLWPLVFALGLCATRKLTHIVSLGGSELEPGRYWVVVLFDLFLFRSSVLDSIFVQDPNVGYVRPDTNMHELMLDDLFLSRFLNWARNAKR